jgi:hypothetical protein
MEYGISAKMNRNGLFPLTTSLRLFVLFLRQRKLVFGQKTNQHRYKQGTAQP